MDERPETATLGDVVIVKHAVGTDAALLTAQLRVAGADPWRQVLLSPLHQAPIPAPDGRLLTLWPRVRLLSASDGEIPWNEIGDLLARLHGLPAPELQPHGGRARLARAMAAAADLFPGGSTDVLRRLALSLMRDWPEGADRLVHGDPHLGNFGRLDNGRLVLASVDNLGLGDPAWDLGLFAGLFGAGLLPDAAWASLLDGYLGGDAQSRRRPWPELDHPARCHLLMAAVAEQRRDYTSPLAATLIETCVRMMG